MKYTLDCSQINTQYIRVTFEANEVKSGSILQLPIWRPGRYEAAHYAKYVRDMRIHNDQGEELPVSKRNASTWELLTTQPENIRVSYEFYAGKLDAGSTYIDEDLIYINFINCLVYMPERITAACEVHINIPEGYQQGCSLSSPAHGVFSAENYYMLADAPLLSSPGLQHLTYTAGDIPFHIWIYGENQLDEQRLINDFQKFSSFQIDCMKEFPESAYHFLLITQPYKLYHGVEHAASTVICLGPRATLSGELYDELLGISSHELFHAWNILKIRPKELLPYKFNEVPVFNTGYVAEGFTTYLGDLFLVASGVKNEAWYLNELGKLYKRHFENIGRLHTSVTDSSIDLWVDGYQASAPHRKSSIYVEGAIIALLLDLKIRLATNHEQSIVSLMNILYYDFARYQKGYSSENIQSIAEQLCNTSLDEFFDKYVYGTEDTRSELDAMLNEFGLEINDVDNENFFERAYGLRISESGAQWKVLKTIPGSPASESLRPDDEVLDIDGQKVTADLISGFSEDELRITILRKGVKKNIQIHAAKHTFFPTYQVRRSPNISGSQLTNLHNWLNIEG
ncbi:M61 family metallopeptidase [Fulvivirga sedimenti]|uniref:M61 family peptidase n=1 Tax=Fulvivirga sedimenti TaxID=2879465 RepID=A0A9X1KZV5_9BACT|nr:M61 family peptidase [Fulvivirga sedimenti]MCA6079233.1 M61 family peptidase [Fulvivirga sedimenti]